MPRFTLQKKLLFFSVILALIPLGVAGRSMIQITQDEVKSFLNDELIVTADRIAQEIDTLYTHKWVAPLMMMKRVVENQELGSSEKLSVLTGIKDAADIVALQISIEGTASPILITQDRFTSELLEAGVTDPSGFLEITPFSHNFQKPELSDAPIWKRDNIMSRGPEYIPECSCWILSVMIPLKDIAGRRVILSAKITMDRIKERIETHPFAKTGGNIMLINSRGEPVFKEPNTKTPNTKHQTPNTKHQTEYEIVKMTKELLNAKIRTAGVAPYIRPSGKKMLAGYTFPSNFDWVVIVEKDATNAYLAVSKMIESLLMMALAGLVIAGGAALIFSRRISRPILEIGKVAECVGRGDFSARVRSRRSDDEIRDLGEQINQMIEGLYERFQLQKFVSDQTIDAIRQQSEGGGIRLGGERRAATVFFSDIRGFTSFSEKHEPEVVIRMLNTYLRSQAHIVRDFNGDIDKYVGDELVAVFQGEDMARDAVRCAIEIHKGIDRLNKRHPDWCIRVGIGINTGMMIMGAMGSEDRMDYTILGNNVNLASRLCSHAGPGETILSDSTYHHIRNPEELNIVNGGKIRVKGKSDAVEIYKVMSDVPYIQTAWPTASGTGSVQWEIL